MKTILIVLMCCALFACESRKGKHVDHLTAIDEAKVKEQIAILSEGSKADDADAEFRYNEARDGLIKMGTGVEPFILFEMKNGRDWSVRLGCIEVLDGIGTKKCVEPLIECLLDEHPLVAQKAMYSLRVFCGHRIVPDTDMPGAPVPPIPQRAENESFEKDYTIWVAWHEQNRKAFYRAWVEWWKANKGEVTVE